MRGELIRDAEASDGNADDPLFREEFEDGAAEASHQGILLDGDDPLELPRGAAEELRVEGFDEPGVDYPDGDSFGLKHPGSGQGRVAAVSDGDHGGRRARRIEKNFAFSDGDGPGILVQRCTDPGSPGVAQGNGAAAARGGLQHVLEFVFVLRRHDDKVWDGTEEGEIEQAVVGGAVGPDEAAPVQRQDYGQLLQADVVDHLVVGALHEGGIDRDDRDEPLRGETGGKGYPMLFGHSHVVEPGGEFAGETVEPRSLGHGRRDRNDPRILLGQCHDRPAKHLRIGGGRRRTAGGDGFPRVDVKRRDAVKPGGIVFGEFVALSLLRHHVDEDGSFQRSDVFKVLDKMVEAMSLQGPHIGEAQLFEDRPGDEEGFKRLLHLAGELQHLFPDAGDRFEEGLDLRPDPAHRLAGHDPVQVGGEGAHIGRDAHLVVV